MACHFLGGNWLYIRRHLSMWWAGSDSGVVGGGCQPTAFSLFLPGLDLVLAHALSPRHADFFFLFGATCSGLAFTTASSAISITFKTPMTSVPLAWFSS